MGSQVDNHVLIDALAHFSVTEVLRSRDLYASFEQFFLQGPKRDSLELLFSLTSAFASIAGQKLLNNSTSSSTLLRPTLSNPALQLSPKPALQSPPKPALSKPTLQPPPPKSAVKQSFRKPKDASFSFASASPEYSQRDVTKVAKAYFWDKFGNSKPARIIDLLVEVSSHLIESQPLDEGSYKKLWEQAGATFSKSSTSRIVCLENGRRNLKRESKMQSLKSRLALLFVRIEIEEGTLAASTNQCRQGVSKATIAINKYAREAKVTVDYVKKTTGAARNYAQLLAKVGPGALICLDPRCSRIWEKHLVQGDIDLLLKFVKENYPSRIDIFHKHDLLGVQLILDGLRSYGWQDDELRGCSGKVITDILIYQEKSEKKYSAPSVSDPTGDGHPTESVAGPVSVYPERNSLVEVESDGRIIKPRKRQAIVQTRHPQPQCSGKGGSRSFNVNTRSITEVVGPTQHIGCELARGEPDATGSEMFIDAPMSSQHASTQSSQVPATDNNRSITPSQASVGVDGSVHTNFSHNASLLQATRESPISQLNRDSDEADGHHEQYIITPSGVEGSGSVSSQTSSAEMLSTVLGVINRLERANGHCCEPVDVPHTNTGQTNSYSDEGLRALVAATTIIPPIGDSIHVGGGATKRPYTGDDSQENLRRRRLGENESSLAQTAASVSVGVDDSAAILNGSSTRNESQQSGMQSFIEPNSPANAPHFLPHPSTSPNNLVQIGDSTWGNDVGHGIQIPNFNGGQHNVEKSPLNNPAPGSRIARLTTRIFTETQVSSGEGNAQGSDGTGSLGTSEPTERHRLRIASTRSGSLTAAWPTNNTIASLGNSSMQAQNRGRKEGPNLSAIESFLPPTPVLADNAGLNGRTALTVPVNDWTRIEISNPNSDPQGSPNAGTCSTNLLNQGEPFNVNMTNALPSIALAVNDRTGHPVHVSYYAEKTALPSFTDSFAQAAHAMGNGKHNGNSTFTDRQKVTGNMSPDASIYAQEMQCSLEIPRTDMYAQSPGAGIAGDASLYTQEMWPSYLPTIGNPGEASRYTQEMERDTTQ
ncbi:hypothetical protein LOZ57_006907 [Ophidiomyces ophidiicola]|uniref:uncharacterized protein n=1 Tax=Ophidiomyces ophidiicola TaxID=1387563 RepID=UPI0020C2A6A2|nr:uncharacterized protein LOZ57_006907 [Ophidiomyces ophidiicola]KAI1935314.1 hypothetical protein LOZ57_006907 [Ophidiomyces ophidiicola]KAI2047928.1 hypothetical protein LOZ43_005503 [Ophidiomyces ophidiicola]KAI2079562.1 hypothetical protein LOZ36_006682 [Ophidiomyces ophidiicola]